MPTTNVMYAGPKMAQFLYDDYNQEKRRIKLLKHRNFSQNEYAILIGIVPQTYGRFLNGAKTMGVDQADLLLRFYKSKIVDLFDYREDSHWDRPTVQAMASLYEMVDRISENEPDEAKRAEARENISRAVSALAQMEPDKRRRLLEVILHIAEHPNDEAGLQVLLTNA